MTKYLFLFTITPVQSFVAEARKAQDFFVGSHLLSELTDVAVEKIEDTSIIFPKKNIKSKPNRFMAVIETSDINKFGNELKEKVEQEFCDRVDKSWNFIEKKPENYEFQKKNYLSITWVAVEYDKNLENEDPQYYFKKYKEIESLLGGAKNIRDFTQLPDTENRRKCSVCGERNALIFRGSSRPYKSQEDLLLLFDKKDGENRPAKYYLNHNGETVEIDSSQYYLMNDKEGLCAICAAKRFDKDAETYKSTSDIALLYTLNQLQEKIEREEDAQEKERLKNLIKKYDPQYLVMLQDDSNARNFKDMDENLKKPTEKLSKEIDKNDIPRTAYYALVAFDGDSMGETLGGEKLENKKNLKKFQGDLSEALGSFAASVYGADGILRTEDGKEAGRVVYAGGEDFFGFINLHYLFPVMTRLREEFDTKVGKKLLEEGYVFKNDKKLSFSAGITIAHVKTPLSVVIGKTREMEKKAKNRSPKKDAFAIAVMKHSGEINCIEMPWRNGDRFYMDDMQKLVDYMSDETLSNTFYQVLQTEFLPIVDESGIVNEWERPKKFDKDKPPVNEQYGKLLEMLGSEIYRTLRRSVSVPDKKRQEMIDEKEKRLGSVLSKEERKKLIDEFKDKAIKDIAERNNSLIDSSKVEGTQGTKFDFQNFFHIFHIIDFIVRETGGLQ